MSRKQVKNALKISALVIKFLRDELTPAERLELETWLKADGRNKALLRRIFDEKLSREDINLTEQFNADQAFDRLITNIRQTKNQPDTKVRLLTPYYKVATVAALLLIVFTAGLFILKNGSSNNQMQVANKKTTRAAPQIMLTLSNGKQIELDKQQQGIITSHGASVVSKAGNGLLTYQPASHNNSNTTVSATNKLEIPRGKMYELVLPDGSKVWLNAQTTLTFPDNFSPAERVVELSGEAYFEIVHMNDRPFRVKTRGQTVEVLGTHFNVSAYPEDANTVTTLTSGSVKVYNDKASCLLKPGQWAQKVNALEKFDVADADLKEALGWKEGVLVFKDATIEELMQTVSRTFDVDIEVDPQVKGRHFGGSYPVKNGLNNLLRNLEQTDVVHFKVKGRRISVMP